MRKLLLLGYTGKMGTAISKVFSDYDIVGKNTKDFNAKNFNQVRDMITKENPDILINCVAKLGINPCDKNPEDSFIMNTLYPKLLAELSSELDFILVHFSTDAVFGNSKDYITEDINPNPISIYGLTKFGGDIFIQHISKKYYICRIPIIFGEVTKSIKDSKQYVENILYRLENGETKLRIAKDVIITSAYTSDVAEKIKEFIEKEYEYGLYHIANEGITNLFEFTKELIDDLYPDVEIEETTMKEFYPDVNRNTSYPITSRKIGSMRNWKEAVKEYRSIIESMKNG